MSIPVHMPMSEAPRRFEVFTGEGRRRHFSAAEKTAIVAESYAGEDSVCGVARRHGLSSSQLFTWRRRARSRLNPVAVPLFVPAVVMAEPETSLEAERQLQPARRARRRRPAVASIELEVGGVVVRVGPDAAAGAIAAVIGALKAGS